LRSTVGDDAFREAVEFPDVVKKESGYSFSCDRRVHQNEVHSFGDSIHNYHNGVVSGGLQELDHKIDTEHIPPCVRNGEQLKLVNWRVSPRFSPEAEIADTYILADVPRYLGPPVVPVLHRK